MSTSGIGVVVIGRNEGERLKNCLQSLLNVAGKIVYVDSGSQDNSVQMAKEMGIHVVELDLTIPFTAARARNIGFQWLLNNYPGFNYVQFVDGDCELVEGWVQKGLAFLSANPQFAVVCGRRRERFPAASIYNRLCDFEWDTPIGETKSCGGDAMMRVDAVAKVGGYRVDLIAGEEPELCVRLRSAGYKIWRLDGDMTLHDAAMMHFSQWWRRTMRGGYAFAEGAYLHGVTDERYYFKESLRAWIWGGIIPMLVLIIGFYKGKVGWVFISLYPLQIVRLALLGKYSFQDNWLRAIFLVLGKFPELLGQFQFLWNFFRRSKAQLIEYK